MVVSGFFESSFKVSESSSLSRTPFLNSETLDPIDRIRLGNRDPNSNRMIKAKITNSIPPKPMIARLLLVPIRPKRRSGAEIPQPTLTVRSLDGSVANQFEGSGNQNFALGGRISIISRIQLNRHPLSEIISWNMDLFFFRAGSRLSPYGESLDPAREKYNSNSVNDLQVDTPVFRNAKPVCLAEMSEGAGKRVVGSDSPKRPTFGHPTGRNNAPPDSNWMSTRSAHLRAG